MIRTLVYVARNSFYRRDNSLRTDHPKQQHGQFPDSSGIISPLKNEPPFNDPLGVSTVVKLEMDVFAPRKQSHPSR
jgi:hypothetical protein